MNHDQSEETNRYKRTVEELHYVANELAQIDSQEAVCQRTIDAAENLLEFDLSIIALEKDELLQPIAISSGLSRDDFEAMSIYEGIAGKTYRTGESYLIDDIATWEEANSQKEWGSGISCPVGEYGNFQAIDSEKEAFDEQDLQLANLLTTHASNHLARIENKRQLEQQNSRLDEFASIVSHDLRNPLNVAQLRLELVRDHCDSEHLDEVANAHERMGTLIDDLLTLAREGKSVISPEPVDLSSVAVAAWTNVGTTDTTLVTNSEQAIFANENALKQLFENLFRNSVEHNTDAGTVTVGELADGFFVEDDGVGIPQDKRNSVFKAGYSTSEVGTGFGLHIVKQIVETHDWDIQITDSSGNGARFEVTGVNFAEG